MGQVVERTNDERTMTEQQRTYKQTYERTRTNAERRYITISQCGSGGQTNNELTMGGEWQITYYYYYYYY